MSAVAGAIVNLRREAVSPDPDQPRKTFNAAALRELAESLDSNGLLQPISVRPAPDSTSRDRRYVIIAGERRWRAAGLLDWQTIPAIVKKGLTDQAAAKLQLLENIVREDLNPVEEARAFQKMLDEGYTTRELGQAMGKSTQYVYCATQMLTAIPEVVHLVGTGAIKPRMAYAMCWLSEANQRKVLRAIQEQGLHTTDVVGLCNRLMADQGQIEMSGLPPREAQRIQETFASALSQVSTTLTRLVGMEEERPGSLGEALDDEAFGRLDELIYWLQRVKRLGREQKALRLMDHSGLETEVADAVDWTQD